MRGTSKAYKHENNTLGIIPACAGNITSVAEAEDFKYNHPRVCGEHKTFDGANPSDMGSSPRVRGTSGALSQDAKRVGIIPACAGNIAAVIVPCERLCDHPRVCGEHHMKTDL